MRKLLLAVAAFVALRTGQASDPADGITRVAGVDASSGIEYVLLSTAGRPAGGTPAAASAAPPRLTAQCTKSPDGKLKFEWLADLGGVPAIAYYPPWKPKSSTDYPPHIPKTQVAMEFLGYTKIKPIKRQWNSLLDLDGELRYATPGMGSANMEDANLYMQYLKALPTLRLTVPGKGAAEWETARWQKAVNAEPLCAMSGL